MTMQIVDLKKQYQLIKQDILNRIEQVLDHSMYIMGPEILELECLLADYVQVKHCVTLANGTDALFIAMMALDIHPGDEIITTPFTFIATAEMIRLYGAVPVFVDIDSRTYNINPTLIEEAITSKTKAIMPVNLYGQCADFDGIDQVAKKHNLVVIEDAAQSFGATYKNRFSCSLGTIGCTSFFPSKPLGCYGDGGACFTDDDELADRIRKIRNHGQNTRYNHITLGLNSRLDSIQAAVLLAKFQLFRSEVGLRQEVARKYNQCLQDHFDIPYIAPYNQSIYSQYTIKVEHRKEVKALLAERGIPTAVHYPLPLHKQPVFQDLPLAQHDLSISEFCATQVISLPCHPYLTDEEIELITSALVETISQGISLESIT
jgi:UDP-2-acetamido-2-deoxy-ribo-hexuluronate aminotransferase